MYVSWLQQEHPDDRPVNLSLSNAQVDEEQIEPLSCNTTTTTTTTTTEDDSTADKENVVPSPEQPTYSLSASIATTRVFVTQLREILDERKVVPKVSTKTKSTARVLTSAETLANLLEKKKKKKEEEEQKEKRSVIESDKRERMKRKEKLN